MQNLISKSLPYFSSAACPGKRKNTCQPVQESRTGKSKSWRIKSSVSKCRNSKFPRNIS